MRFPEYFREGTDTASRVCMLDRAVLSSSPGGTRALVLFRVTLFANLRRWDVSCRRLVREVLRNGQDVERQVSVQENADYAKKRHPIAITQGV